MRLAIYGYGNVGRGVALAAAQQPDMTLAAVFTRRAPESVSAPEGVPVYPAAELDAHLAAFDVLLACGGSATELPEMTPMLAARCSVVDSFDDHARIPAHFARVDAAARAGGHVALVCGGWDPGLFSLLRLYAAAVLPDGNTHTFWGRGVSQGHSDAARRVPGVLDARQYTVPLPAALAAARGGGAALPVQRTHRREVYVVAAENTDRAAIARAIAATPDYYAGYDTRVTFITAEEMARDHAALPHGGCVLRAGKTGARGEHRQTLEARLTLDSNPEFTGSVLVALARAVYRLASRGEVGCRTVFDIAPAELSPLSGEELRAGML